MSRIGLIGLVLAAACNRGPGVGGGGQPVASPTAAADSPLFVHFPELDHRVVQVDRETGEARKTYYPDDWALEAGHLLDFAVDRKRLYALVGNRRAVDDPRLFVVDLETGKLEQALPLAPWPENLAWTCDGKLLVGHATPERGPGGHLTVVDPRKPAVLRTVSLEGGASVVVAAGRRALVVERRVLEGPEEGADKQELFVVAGLAEVDLRAGKVTRRRSLPPGARAASLGPSGHLYVSQASGPGTLATDGTVTVVDLQSLRPVHRLRLDMVVRRMVATRERLVLNMLSRTGDVWIAVMKPDDSTLFDFRLRELTGYDLAVAAETIYVPLRRDHTLLRADLSGMKDVPRLEVKVEGAGERLGLVRTVMECRDAG
jgi:hypothetical protein